MARLTNPWHSPHGHFCVPVGHPCPGSCLDTGFSFEISRNQGWSSSEAAEELAWPQALACAWGCLGQVLKAGLILGLKLRSPDRPRGRVGREGCSELVLLLAMDTRLPKLLGASAVSFQLWALHRLAPFAASLSC